MSARILDFPCETVQLALPGFVLIAWRRGREDGWLWGIWKPMPGPGPRWYQAGWLPPGQELDYSRTSRSRASKRWHAPFADPCAWHYLMSEAAAFPEKPRQYL
ncbi:MAG: hypothetical protein NT005_02105 [Spirochaetes bacterium]|nr:hypothetical protein [Spirochaetota bacterium]